MKDHEYTPELKRRLSNIAWQGFTPWIVVVGWNIGINISNELVASNVNHYIWSWDFYSSTTWVVTLVWFSLLLFALMIAVVRTEYRMLIINILCRKNDGCLGKEI